uniref:F-box/LRR-repeat protein 15/At3g58940/PEG3-like LRR domain-containing protein n=1 Tax=Kalanchoe fedtschenkoi TaxID=63787 RepID=A0A7N0VG97_KALFE
MPIRDAVRTSLLSRKWRHRWTAVREIVFDKNFVEGAVELRISNTESSTEIKKYEYCRVIDRFLLVHAGPIYRFLLHVPTFGDPAQPIDITQWILVVSQKGVKDLVIDASGSIDALRSYAFTVKLPSYLYRCTELKHLKLCICELSPPPKSFAGFCNLVSLDLVDVCTRGHAITAFISQCPVLEELSLTLIPHRPVPAHPFPLSVCAPNLKTLRIRDSRFTTLSLKSCPKLVTLSLEGVLSLSNADENSSSLDEIFISSLKVEDVTLSNFALIALAQYHIPRQLPMPLADHTRLTLLCVDTLSLKQVKCVFCILRSSPNLKTLNISVSDHDWFHI